MSASDYILTFEKPLYADLLLLQFPRCISPLPPQPLREPLCLATLQAPPIDSVSMSLRRLVLLHYNPSHRGSPSCDVGGFLDGCRRPAPPSPPESTIITKPPSLSIGALSPINIAFTATRKRDPSALAYPAKPPSCVSLHVFPPFALLFYRISILSVVLLYGSFQNFYDLAEKPPSLPQPSGPTPEPQTPVAVSVA